ncbi:hypothetical protein Q73_13495 [Bacillus coahuilensis m2-6]|uniref:glycosyltransferase n=1 Tax=Bacillus coahuilensis TaxID=408580 RepID=UPI0007502D02|nr:glycosyltransferase [Bacillus coahuilensis]KUP05094.1 hypothetical protein Q73_13495 [Bacillus coahuilensis m2-6]
MFKLCDGLVFQTKDAMDYHGKLIAQKSTVIPNPYIRKGKPLDIYTGEREKVIATAAARFEHKKGIDILISAFFEVHKKHPDYRLVIFGAGHLYNQYIEQIKKLKIADKVDFPGLVSDVAMAVHKSKVFVLPSRFEGVPNVLMEVMGAGVPTIASDCHPGGPRLLTDNGRSGILVPVEDVSSMAKAICRIIEDEKLEKQLSRDGMNHIQSFSKEK